MKINKWTVALAAAGLVSLPVAGLAEEKPNQVLTALQGTSISGYVDTSAQWNFGTGNANNPPYRFGGADKADGFNLNVVQLRIEKPIEEGEWAAGYRVDLWFGPDANTLGTQFNAHASEGDFSGGDFAIRQAYVALRMPVGNGIDWKIGVFDSIIGYESVESPSNPNHTRSYGHSIEPTTHTGALASYRITSSISLSGGIANTMGPQINARAFGEDPKAESYKTYMGSVTLTAPEGWGFLAGSTLYGGVVNGYSDDEVSSDIEENTTSWYAGATVNTPLKGLKVGAAYDYLDVHNSKDNIWALGGYVSFQLSDKLSLHARGEYADSRSPDGYLSYGIGKVISGTGTIQYDLWQNVLTRLEFRWDHNASGDQTFGGESDPNRVNAYMLAANVIYKF